VPPDLGPREPLKKIQGLSRTRKVRGLPTEFAKMIDVSVASLCNREQRRRTSDGSTLGKEMEGSNGCEQGARKEAYLKQYVDRPSGEPVRLDA
jgi:hypothetical protein